MPKNFLLAFSMSFIIILSWNLLKNKNTTENSTAIVKTQESNAVANNEFEDSGPSLLKIDTKVFVGEISLRGLRVTHINLNDYKENINSNKTVSVLTDQKSEEPYFINFGFNGSGLILPNNKTLWKANKEVLSEDSPVELSWKNKAGVIFTVDLKIQDDYLLMSEMKVHNPTENTFELSMYCLINKSYNHDSIVSNSILHEGIIGVFDSKLEEYSYNYIKDQKNQNFLDSKVNWFGITEKYWLVAIIPNSNNLYNSGMQYDFVNGADKIQVNISTKQLKLEPNETIKTEYNIFVGPKKFNILDNYEKKYNIKLFDRAIDFGWLYFITKPLFLLLIFINNYLINFGVSILVLTLVLKILMFGITNKAYQSMQKMKDIQPKIDQLKEKFPNDKIQLNKEIFELYKKNNINPFIGLLSILIQIPLFFGIYKVLYVTIEMRHAPFFGWVKDLSSVDSSNIFTLFGLFDHSFTFLHLGLWPILMAISMYIQQFFTPIQDPTQAKIMKFLPLIFLFTFANFPVGLLIYWTFSNLISIIQQYLIKRSSIKNAVIY